MCDFVACTRLNCLVVLVYFDVKKGKLRNITVKRFLSFLYNVLEINVSQNTQIVLKTQLFNPFVGNCYSPHLFCENLSRA